MSKGIIASKRIVASKRIYFRPICTNDIDNGWLEWINDPVVNKYLVSRGPITRESLIQYLDDSKPPLVQMFAVCMIENDKYIGNARLSSIDWINRRANYGRLIGRHNLRGKGIGTEVLMLLSYYAFYHLNLNRIETGVFSINVASVRSNEKAGAVQEGILRKSEYINDVYEDIIRFGIIREDFEKTSWKEILGIS